MLRALIEDKDLFSFSFYPFMPTVRNESPNSPVAQLLSELDQIDRVIRHLAFSNPK